MTARHGGDKPGWSVFNRGSDQCSLPWCNTSQPKRAQESVVHGNGYLWQVHHGNGTKGCLMTPTLVFYGNFSPYITILFAWNYMFTSWITLLLLPQGSKQFLSQIYISHTQCNRSVLLTPLWFIMYSNNWVSYYLTKNIVNPVTPQRLK